MYSRCFIPLTALFTALAPLAVSAQAPAAYAVADATTGHIFDSANASKKLQIASLTKIATAMVVIDWAEAEKADLSQSAAIPPAALQISDRNPVGYQPGDSLSLRDLLYAALMQSDNIAAETLATHVGSTLKGEQGLPPVTLFVAQMNALARKLGMESTLFLNPHGLETGERKLPYSTAADLVRLTRYAMANSAFRFYVSQQERRIAIRHPDGTTAGYLLKNTNELLGQDGIDGVKTGTTQRAGDCLILSAARAPESRQNGTAVTVILRRLIVVVLGAQNRFGVGKGLLDRGWERYDQWAAAGRPVKEKR